jgi:hypothetical protein
MNAELQKIQFSKAHTNSSQSGKQYAYSEQTSSSLLSLWVQPSDEGWKLLGILWYWWTLLAMYIATALLAWKGNANWSLMRLWLSLQHKIYV